MMKRNPFCSPAKENFGRQRLTQGETSRPTVACATARGVVFGGVVGGIGGAVILLTLRFLIHVPVLMPGSPRICQAVAAMMAFAVVPSAAVGAIGFGIRAIAG